MKITDRFRGFARRLTSPPETPRDEVRRKLSDPVIGEAYSTALDRGINNNLGDAPTTGIARSEKDQRPQPTPDQLRDPGYFHEDKVRLPSDFVPREPGRLK